MKGRIYDPTLGRFLQADPHIQAPMNSQSYNRYSYVLNNPLSYTDPSGYFFKKIGKFFKKYGRIIVAAVAAYYTFGAVSGLLLNAGGACSIALTTGQAMLAGAASGFVGGGIATGSLRGAVTGAASGAVFAGVGSAFNSSSGFFETNGVGHISSHAVTGGVLADLQGGKFGHGFFSAGLTKGLNVNGMIDSFGTAYDAARVAVSAIIGGTISKITGGKFGNGAVSSAMGQMLNGNSQIKGRQNNPIGYKTAGSIPMKMGDGKYYWVDKETFGQNIGTDYMAKQTGTPFAEYNETTKQEVINVATGVATVSGFGGLAFGSLRLGQLALGASVTSVSLNPTIEGAGWLAVDMATMRMGPLIDGTMFQGLEHVVGAYSWLLQTGNAAKTCQAPMRC